MKKIIFFIALMFAVAAISNAQNATYSPSQTTGTYVYVNTDHVLTNTTAKWFQYNFEPPYYTAQKVSVNIDSTSGNLTNLAVALYGRTSDLETWTAIGSAVNWKGTVPGTGADTTILITNATEVGYRQFKLLFTGTGTGTATIDKQAFKIYYGTP